MCVYNVKLIPKRNCLIMILSYTQICQYYNLRFTVFLRNFLGDCKLNS